MFPVKHPWAVDVQKRSIDGEAWMDRCRVLRETRAEPSSPTSGGCSQHPPRRLLVAQKAPQEGGAAGPHPPRVGGTLRGGSEGTQNWIPPPGEVGLGQDGLARS